MPAAGGRPVVSSRRSSQQQSDDSSDDVDLLASSSDDNDSSDDHGHNKTCFTDERLLLRDPLLSPSSSKEGSTSNTATSMTSRPLSLASNMACKLDTALASYTKYMASSLHQDRGLKLLQWTLWLSSRMVLLKQNHHGGANTSKTRSDSLQYMAQCLRKLYLDVSFARYATRAFGLPPAIAAARTGSWGYQASSTLTIHRRVHDVLGRVMAVSMMGYYPTELLAYMQWMLPAKPSSETVPYSRSAERWSAWSCRFWLAYLVAETCQCLLVLKEVRDQEQGNTGTEDDDDKNAKADRQGLARYAKLQLLRDALFALPCLTWSLPNWDVDPLLPESVVNGLMWLESIVCLYQ